MEEATTTTSFESASQFMDMIFGLGMVAIIIIALIPLIIIVAYWIIFKKANQPGWASIIPVYSGVILAKIINKPIWWVILLLIPGIGQIIALVMTYQLARVFGKGMGYFFGMMFLPFVFYPILAFGKAKYIGDGQVQEGAMSQQMQSSQEMDSSQTLEPSLSEGQSSVPPSEPPIV